MPDRRFRPDGSKKFCRHHPRSHKWWRSTARSCGSRNCMSINRKRRTTGRHGARTRSDHDECEEKAACQFTHHASPWTSRWRDDLFLPNSHSCHAFPRPQAQIMIEASLLKGSATEQPARCDRSTFTQTSPSRNKRIVPALTPRPRLASGPREHPTETARASRPRAHRQNKRTEKNNEGPVLAQPQGHPLR